MKKISGPSGSDIPLFSAVVPTFEGVATGFTRTFGGAVADFDSACDTFVAFGVIGAVFNTAIYTVFGFAIVHTFHPFRQVAVSIMPETHKNI